MRIRSMIAGCLLLGLAVFLTGCGSAEVPEPVAKRIIILTNGNSPYWDAAATGARDAAAELKVEEAGLTVMVDRNDYEVEGQINKLKQYANSTDVAAVGISVTDAENAAIADELRHLRESGIQVVTIDSDVDRETARDARFAYLGTDNVQGGRELGVAAKGLLPNGGEYATFVGLKGAANAIERISGVADGLGTSMISKENMGDGGSADTARKNVRDALDRNPNLNLLVGIWSYNTPAIVDIVKELGIREKVKIVGFDAEPPAIEAMADGMVDVMVVQNPYQMGYQGVKLLKAMVEEDQATIDEILPDQGSDGGDLCRTGLKVVVPDGTTSLKREMFDSNTEFLTLSEFRAWLREHGLSGS
ncbi:substrate-binding domain-containing protein [Symmachiella dynata]|uniref:substrate-binding domain-containing protein n=1 Tax=Symmachiella dynata TaxID=2527995 RepID=UPI0030EB9290